MKALARVLFLAGAVAIGLFLFRAAPRDVTLVYGLRGTHARSLEVDVERGGETIRRAEFWFSSGTPASVRHHLRLTDGQYELHLVVGGESGPRSLERSIDITESGTIVIPLGS